jgi:hypothetical protein
MLLIAALCPFVASLALVPDGADQPAFTATLAAQGQTIWEGVYTDEQAERGERAYEQECAFRWSDLSVSDMYVAIRTTMPQGAPASLSPAGYADISAFLLQKNKLPSGDTELPTDTDDLEEILITEAQ